MRHAEAKVTLATTVVGTPDNLVELKIPVGKLGTNVYKIEALPGGSTALNQLQIYIKDGAGAPHLIASEVMPLYTHTAGVKIPATNFAFVDDENPLPLGQREKLYCGIGVALAQGVYFRAHYEGIAADEE